MKKGTMALTLAFAIGLTSFQGCIGNFVVTKKILNWNQRLSSKWVNELVFLLMVIIPVYGVAVLIDGIVLNSIEFWTGSNPLAMKAGEVETKYVSKDGVKYKIEVSQNRYHFIQLEGPKMGDSADLIYNPETKIWSISNGRVIKKMAQFLENKDVKIYKKDGSTVIVKGESIFENTNINTEGRL
jgi:hypothetical protein